MGVEKKGKAAQRGAGVQKGSGIMKKKPEAKTDAVTTPKARTPLYIQCFISLFYLHSSPFHVRRLLLQQLCNYQKLCIFVN